MPKRTDKLMATRRTLLSRLRNWDDQDSWREFFNIYWKLIYSFALRSGLLRTEAEEVVQETMLAVAKKLPGFHYDPKIGSFKAWLLHTTQWKVRDQLRKRQRLNRVKERFGENEVATANAEDVTNQPNAHWDEEWNAHLLHAAIERVRHKVSTQQFQVFQLYGLDGWPASEVARQLGVNHGQIYVAKCRIQRLIKKELAHLEKHMV